MSIYRPTYSTKDGKRRKSKVWWIEYWVDGDRQRRSLGVRDHKVARMIESEILRSLELSRAGLPSFEAVGRKSPDALLGEYESELRRRRCSDTHVTRTVQRIRTLIEDVDRITQLTPARIREALESVRASGKSAKTENYYRVALNGFFNWLVREGRWGVNPVAAVKRVREDDPKRRRRSLSADELARLLRMAPGERRVVYLLASSTGLRRGELSALSVSDVDIAASTVTVRASSAKNRREVVLPLPPTVARKLGSWIESREGEPLLFDRIPSMALFKADLKQAEIRFETKDGVVDFHALRVTYATMLARAGVSLVQTQGLMRHSDPKLTANVYTRLHLKDAHTAVSRLEFPEDL